MLNSQTVAREEILPNEIDDAAQITFTGLELKFFALELKDMIAAGEFDIAKAMTGARFYAEIARRTADIKAGKFKSFADEEWDKFIREQEA